MPTEWLYGDTMSMSANSKKVFFFMYIFPDVKEF